MAVGVVDVDETGAARTANAILEGGGRAVAVGADVADEQAASRAVEQVSAALGPVTVLVNNAGIIRDNLLFKMSVADWDAVMNVHLRGAFLLTRAVQAHMVQQFSKFVSMIPYLPDELQVVVMNIKDPGKVTDLIASNLNISLEEKQELLSTLDVRTRLERLATILNREIELLELGHKIQSQVQSELNKNQKEFYLRQQLKAIQRELGEGDSKAAEIEELRKRLEEAKLPPEAQKAADHELERLRLIPPESAEHTAPRTATGRPSPSRSGQTA